MSDFQDLVCLPCCGGAVDGTFMHIRKPTAHGDSYWCYKHFTAILVLGVIDARGIFTYVKAGTPGSAGDAATFARSRLVRNIEMGEWLPPGQGRSIQVPKGTRLDGPTKTVKINPYIVGDTAFPLGPTVMKCYRNPANERQEAFNYCVIRTRRVVEQAFGMWKGRFQVLSRSFLNKPEFAAQVSLFCYALHNICMRYRCPFERSWTISHSKYKKMKHTRRCHQSRRSLAKGEVVRKALAKYALKQSAFLRQSR